MLRRVLLVVALTGLMGLLPVASASAQRGGTCSLQGTAAFSPGLTATPSTSVNYTFTGTVSNCVSSDSTVTSGSISASGSATGSGISCGGGTSAGTATISWNNGTSTTVSFSTTSAGALVAVQSTVTSSSEPALAAGDQGGGGLVFETQTPQDCTTATGLTSAAFSGQIGFGAA
jgi:hypothetical protein